MKKGWPQRNTDECRCKPGSVTGWIFSLVEGPLPYGRGSDRSHERSEWFSKRHEIMRSQY